MSVTFIPPKPWHGRVDIEDGDQARRLHHLEGSGTRALIGFACDIGIQRNHGRPGARQAPSAIRQILADLAAPAKARTFTDLGTVDADLETMEAGQEELAGRIGAGLKSYERIIVLGGGHETAYASFLGLRSHAPNKKIGIINLDAHLDLRTVGEPGPSSGTPFTQIRHMDPGGFDYLCVGAATESNTRAVVNRAADWGVKIVQDRKLIGDVHAADRPIESIIARSDLVYLSIDMDVLPQEQAPGVSAPAARGVPFTTIEYLIDFIFSRCKTYGVPLPLADIVEVSPPHDVDHMTTRRAAFLARRLLLS